MKVYEWQELSYIISGNDVPTRSGDIELTNCPRIGEYIEVGEDDQLQVTKVVHRPRKPTLLIC